MFDYNNSTNNTNNITTIMMTKNKPVNMKKRASRLHTTAQVATTSTSPSRC